MHGTKYLLADQWLQRLLRNSHEVVQRLLIPHVSEDLVTGWSKAVEDNMQARLLL
jgi:hypothetical protein